MNFKVGIYDIHIEVSNPFKTNGWFNILPVFSIQHKYWYEWKINIGFLSFDMLIYIINNDEYNNYKYFE